MRRWLLGLGVVLLTSGCTHTTGPDRQTVGPGNHATASTARASPGPSHRARGRLQVSRLPARLPKPLAREAVAPSADRSHAVVAGGLLAGDTSSRSTYLLDLRTGRSSGLPPLTTAIHDTAGTAVSGHALVLGGGNATEQSDVQERGRGGWHVVGHLPAPRSDLASATGHGLTYVVGGYDGRTSALADVLASADGRRWKTVARLPVPVRYAPAILVGTTLWVFGGEVDGRMVRVVQRIDLRTGAARVAGRLPLALGHSAAVRLGARVLLVGGRTGSGTVTSKMWWFRPDSMRFRRAGRLPTPLADTAVVDTGRTAFLVGGETPSLSDRIVRLRWVGR